MLNFLVKNKAKIMAQISHRRLSSKRTLIVRVNSQKEFVYTSNCNMDLKGCKKNRKDFILHGNPIWEKSQEEGGDRIAVDSTEVNPVLLARYLSKNVYHVLVHSRYLIYPGVSVDNVSHAGFNNRMIYTL